MTWCANCKTERPPRPGWSSSFFVPFCIACGIPLAAIPKAIPWNNVPEWARELITNGKEAH